MSESTSRWRERVADAVDSCYESAIGFAFFAAASFVTMLEVIWDAMED